ncbi:hypothetical protein V8G54_029648, partial [Vigna mungo]
PPEINKFTPQPTKIIIIIIIFYYYYYYFKVLNFPTILSFLPHHTYNTHNLLTFPFVLKQPQTHIFYKPRVSLLYLCKTYTLLILLFFTHTKLMHQQQSSTSKRTQNMHPFTSTPSFVYTHEYGYTIYM